MTRLPPISTPLRTADFHFDLPPHLIAQHPTPQRDQSRLMVLRRSTETIQHAQFSQLPDLLSPGDLIVLNDSKVIPARLFGQKTETRGEVELLLTEEIERNFWRALVRPAKRLRTGSSIHLRDAAGHLTPISAVIREKHDLGLVHVEFLGTADLRNDLDSIGHLPLPPYITRESGHADTVDRERYQTVYAAQPGSVAAPTAGLHFTPPLLRRLQQREIESVTVTLHVGLGTFSPIKTEDLGHHRMHEESYHIPDRTARALEEARQQQRRIVAIGTTSTRVLESVARVHDGRIVAGPGRTQLFLQPPSPFAVTGGLVTNLHLPESTLLVLVSAFAAPGQTSGRDFVLRAYAEAVAQQYRFFSYGDAMLLL